MRFELFSSDLLFSMFKLGVPKWTSDSKLSMNWVDNIKLYANYLSSIAVIGQGAKVVDWMIIVISLS